MQMQIDGNGLTAKTYRVAHFLWWGFRSSDIPEPPARVDLCTLLRTIFISAPIALFVNVLAVAAVLGSVGYFLFGLYLFASAVGFLVVFALIIATVVSVLYFSGWLFAAIARAPVTQEIVGVVGEYYRAKKARVCPIIEMKGTAR